MKLLGRTVGRLNEKFLITRIKAIKVYYAKSSIAISLSPSLSLSLVQKINERGKN